LTQHGAGNLVKKLVVLTGEEERQVSLQPGMIADAATILEKMDHDMDKGWQLGKHFVSSPNTIQRCQIAANRLLTALHTENEASVALMSAYILTRLDDVRTVSVNTEGEAEETLFYTAENSLIT